MSGWKTETDGSRVWKYTLEATPLDELFHKQGNHHVATRPISTGAQAIVDEYLHRAETLYNRDNKQHNVSRAEEYEDWFPHKELPIFTRNEKICQEFNARERKRNIEKEQDGRTWSQ